MHGMSRNRQSVKEDKKGRKEEEEKEKRERDSARDRERERECVCVCVRESCLRGSLREVDS
ncbi:predicted protein [Sclerotinia sclerotiorum 1980 UF-70]|uniref:Uncharacterized protein n=1 Tax=Sclerotinia sclerotiorum (strain ATCC 18683 / 1980 / Ss-1) TaxID=665079 RepID=A7F6H2_SCLS1|nr:predicted protein [Sclerotinia sclerotiorum 1980 UF-70]EDN98343.1 predicted protein [Sclerotinia sclerotiorum 1980 UF-70]